MQIASLLQVLAVFTAGASALAIQERAPASNPFASWKVGDKAVVAVPSRKSQVDLPWLDFTPVSNDFSCKSEAHPNPVILLHALFVSKDFDLNWLQNWLKAQGYCTFSSNYGFIDGIPIGGVRSINESSWEVANFINEVASKTGARKVDLIGHSEGGLQALYVSKFRNVSHLVDKIISIAPPTHGTTLSGLYSIATVIGNGFEDLVDTVLKGVGCGACADMVPGSPLMTQFTTGPISQPGNKVNIIATRRDLIVTPQRSAFVMENGVQNYFVQDFCPADLVGHISLAIDQNVWLMVRNILEGTSKKIECGLGGLPFVR